MKIAFSTSHLLRKERYKIITTVYQSRGRLYVRKIAASRLSIAHINTIAKSEQIIKNELSYLKYAAVISQKRGMISYEYVNLPTFSQLIEKAIIGKNFDEALNLVKRGLEVIDKINFNRVNPYDSSEFSSLLDPKKIYDHSSKEECVLLGVMDIKFDNLLIDNQDIYLIDYEWVYNFPVPKNYLKFRALFYLTNSLQFIIDTLCSVNFPCYRLLTDHLIPWDWYDLIPLTHEDLVRFFNYETNFQNHVNIIQTTFLTHSIIKQKEIVTHPLMEDLNSSVKMGKDLASKKVLKIFLLENEVSKLRKQLVHTNDELTFIKSSKFFKIWQKYTKLRDRV